MSISPSRRNALQAMVDRCRALLPEFEVMSDAADDLYSEMSDAWDAKSERWQESDTGQAASAVVDAMSAAALEICDLRNQIESTADALDEVLA